MDYVDRIIEALKAPGKTQRGLSMAISNDSTVANKIIKRIRKMQDNEFNLAATYLGVSLEWLITGIGGKEIQHLQPRIANVMEKVQFGPDTIPILGHANGSQDAVILSMDDEIGRVLRHPKQQGMNSCFAVYARGESMYPRFKPGQILYAVKDKPANHGEDCVIELNSGESFVKEFVKLTTKEIVCKQFNPPKEWKRPISDLKSIHAIVGTG